MRLRNTLCAVDAFAPQVVLSSRIIETHLCSRCIADSSDYSSVLMQESGSFPYIFFRLLLYRDHTTSPPGFDVCRHSPARSAAIHVAHSGGHASSIL